MSDLADDLPLLHNVSMRPTTPAEGVVRGSAGPRLVISLDLLHPSPLWDVETDRRARARAIAVRAAELAPGLDAAWARLALTGAVLLWNTPGDVDADVIDVTDPMLAINVLARAQGEILIAGAPARLEPALLARKLSTDDPRLVAAAALTAHTAGDRP